MLATFWEHAGYAQTQEETIGKQDLNDEESTELLIEFCELLFSIRFWSTFQHFHGIWYVYPCLWRVSCAGTFVYTLFSLFERETMKVNPFCKRFSYLLPYDQLLCSLGSNDPLLKILK